MTSNSTVPAQAIPTPGSSSSRSSGSANTNTIPTAIPSTTLEGASAHIQPAMDSMATAEEARKASTSSPPIDPSKLNNLPANLPTSPPLSHTQANTASPFSPPLRSPDASTTSTSSLSAGGSAPDSSLDTTSPSGYLDTGMPIEPSSHPTIAETGILASSPDGNPGPRQGQLKRVEKPNSPEGIIKLGSLGGEGLKIKPPVRAEDAHGPAQGQ
ncbi:hypothetical protein I317_06195 [Kwoniella heveanensis CBS 569]|uniref:Uncharacterized protein n=1 Tax=Kwoniella heveanensis BCC8398 TaxID=1296120 RepID=A0A1B9GJS0_9TREE|nr:hypothetical protein I316_07034 [Kwoniella heveanensis BCC8398]OCF39998.1 hypothetical protein I317_06195 [Kwoniella heveanensis CBS 569]